jgi:N-acetylmuramic acid 6-phosphate (MurNAc-6-P) etherase
LADTFLEFRQESGGQFAAITAGATEPFQENVPTPGKFESDGSAIEGPPRMKARARRKLVMRIIKVSVSTAPHAPFAGNLIPQRCFRLSAQKRKMVSSQNRIVSSEHREETLASKNSMISG